MPSHSKHGISINIKQNSSVLKIKQKNKRRNRKKRKQKAQYPIHEMSNITTTMTCSNVDNATDANYTTRNQMAVANMWAKSYERMIRFQFQHRIQYWKNLAIKRNTEICRLRKNLRKQNQNNSKIFELIDSSEDEASVNSSNQEDLVSESYLKFLEITLRHRQERKHKTSDNKEQTTDSD